MSLLMQALTIVAAVGASAVGGALFTFSTFTMAGLKGLGPSRGAAAMQSINRQATTPPLMLLMFGTGLACLFMAVDALLHLDATGSIFRLAAAVTYIAGVLMLTGTYHVPRNNALAALDASSPEGQAYWAVYLKEWVGMNHVRTAASFAAAILLLLGLR